MSRERDERADGDLNQVARSVTVCSYIEPRHIHRAPAQKVARPYGRTMPRNELTRQRCLSQTGRLVAGTSVSAIRPGSAVSAHSPGLPPQASAPASGHRATGRQLTPSAASGCRQMARARPCGLRSVIVRTVPRWLLNWAPGLPWTSCDGCGYGHYRTPLGRPVGCWHGGAAFRSGGVEVPSNNSARATFMLSRETREKLRHSQAEMSPAL